MKGLLLKDFYTLKSSIISLIITFTVIGLGISYFVAPQALIIISTIVLSFSVTSAINIDKKSGWLKSSITFPTRKNSFITCKYVMYSLMSIIGIIFGITFSTIISFMTNDTSFSFLSTFTYLSVVMTFFSGSILIPCFYLLDEEKSMIGAMISYPIGTCFVYIMMKFIENTVLAMTIGTVISVILFIVSWYFLSKHVENTDIK